MAAIRNITLRALALLACAAPAQGLRAQTRFLLTRPVVKPLKDYFPEVAAGDIDGDGDLDLLATRGGIGVFFFINDGDAVFTDETAKRMPKVGSLFYKALALGDVDADGDLDCVVATDFFQRDVLLLNDGKGVFKAAGPARFPTQAQDSSDVVLVDVDADGDLDAVFAGRATLPTHIFLNDGKGNFKDDSAARLPVSDFASSIVAGDLDGDGDPDLVVGRMKVGTCPCEKQDEVWLNDGRGKFTRAKGRLPPRLAWTRTVLLEDADGDGDLDLFVTDSKSTGRIGHRAGLLINDGKGFFRDETATRLKNAWFRYQVPTPLTVDVDHDGDPDLVLGLSTDRILLYLNDGKGRFGLPALVMPYRGNSWALAAGDFDGDGDLDVAAASTFFFLRHFGGFYILSNRERQVDAPTPPHLGSTYRVDYHAAAGPVLVLPFLATARARIPVPPLGTFFLDLRRAVAGAPLAILPKQGGIAAVDLTIPADPALLGLVLSSQGVYLDATLRLTGFSNAVSAKVR